MVNASSFKLATDSWDQREYDAIQRVVKSGRFTMAHEVQAFERDSAAYFGARHSVMVNSGSSANLLAIAALVYHPDGLLKPGDEVIVPAVSWSTTYYPIHQLGLKLRFADVDRRDLNLDLDKLEAALTPATRAVFAVNLLGNPVDLVRLKAFCDAHRLLLIEDNCESMGARIGGKFAGTYGVCGTFSTFFSHHISTMEGGFILTDDVTIKNILLSLRAHGWVREQPADTHLEVTADAFMRQYRFVLPGYNVRPLEMSGAIGQEQLRKLDAIVLERRRNADYFRARCGDIEGFRLQEECGESSWFGFAMVLDGKLAGKRGALVQKLADAKIDCRPIVAGNFLNNPVIAHLNHSIAPDIVVAEELDANGIFVGNHHFPIPDEIDLLESVLREFARSAN